VTTDLDRLGRRLVGAWTTEATRLAVPGDTVPGTAEVKWLARFSYDNETWQDDLRITHRRAETG
jgi:hypothetical protein